MTKNVICLWYDGTAEQAARFYAQTFPDSAVTGVHHAPGDCPGGNQGQMFTVEFTVVGVACLGWLRAGSAAFPDRALLIPVELDQPIQKRPALIN